MLHRPRRRAPGATLAVLAVAVAALALPAGASAAYSGTVAGATATLTGDDAGDALVIGVTGATLSHNLTAGGFASAIDFDSATAGDQTLPSDGTASIVVAAGGGDDTVTAAGVTAAQIAAFTADGGPGNDVITGTGDADALRGGDGNDRVVGFLGGDDMEGGAGNDVLVWNNGDGSDVMDGDAGNDEVEVNGAATAGDAFTIAAAGARTRFDRTNLIPFTLDVSAERMTVNGLGGGDTIAGGAGLAPLVLLTLDGGVGADSIGGGDGADLIRGGEENDTLAGGGGDDRVAGDRGDDTMSGGPGDDTLVWNNGDNNDRMDGEDGSDTVEVNGAVGAGDAFTLAPTGARTRFDRTNLVPFFLDVATTETLAVNGLGGDDTFTAAAGTEAGIETLALDGGAGNDTLTGGASNDLVLGGSGNDTLAGAGGGDSVSGGAGDDALALRDGAADLGVCGAGTDRAQADTVGIDALTGCETVDQPPAADTQATAVVIRASSNRVRRSVRRARVGVRLECPAAELGGCAGTVTIATRGTVRIGRVRARVVLGTARFTLRAGEARRVRVRLVSRATRLARRGRLRVRATVVTRDAAGNLAQSSRRLTIRVVRR